MTVTNGSILCVLVVAMTTSKTQQSSFTVVVVRSQRSEDQRSQGSESKRSQIHKYITDNLQSKLSH